jgi:hypothetical protein
MSRSTARRRGAVKEGKGPKKNKDNSKDSAAMAEEKGIEARAAVEEVPAEENHGEIVAAAGNSPAQPRRVHVCMVPPPNSTTRARLGICPVSSPTRPLSHAPSWQQIKVCFMLLGLEIFGLRSLMVSLSASTPILLKDVLHAPDMGLTIVSADRICKAGNSVTFRDDTCTIKNKDNKDIGVIPTSANGLYRVKHAHTATTTLERVNLPTLHR